jgi:hypothetical protein
MSRRILGFVPICVRADRNCSDDARAGCRDASRWRVMDCHRRSRPSSVHDDAHDSTRARNRGVGMKRTPTSVRAVAVSLALISGGCSGESVMSSSPIRTAPASNAPPPTGPTVTLTGTVIDPSGSGVTAWVGASPLRWTSVWSGPPRSTQADASGQYRFAALPQHPDAVYVRASKDGYVQQCASTVTLQADTSVSLTIAPFANARIEGLPTSPQFRHISGVVYEGTGIARRPLAGAWVGWEPIMDTVVADTRTDAQGRYRLCGLPKSRIEGVFAVRAGTYRPAYVVAEASDDVVIDFELP